MLKNPVTDREGHGLGSTRPARIGHRLGVPRPRCNS